MSMKDLQWAVRIFNSKGDLGSVLRTYMVEGEDDSLWVSSDLILYLKDCIYPVNNISPEDGANHSLGVWVRFSD